MSRLPRLAQNGGRRRGLSEIGGAVELEAFDPLEIAVRGCESRSATLERRGSEQRVVGQKTVPPAQRTGSGERRTLQGHDFDPHPWDLLDLLLISGELPDEVRALAQL